MAYGDTPHDEMLRKAWEGFCDRLKDAAPLVFRDGAASTPLDRASGFRYLSRQISRGLDITLEYNDPLFPQFRRNQFPTRKYGGDNADALNLRARIDGQHTYRVVGNRGVARYVAFTLHKPSPDLAWMGKRVAILTGDQLQVEWDGSFELILSPDPHPGNWLQTTPDTDQLSIRQFFGDWNVGDPLTIRIERVDADGPPAPLTPEFVAEGLKGAADLVVEQSEYWAWREDELGERINAFAPSWARGRFDATPGGFGLVGRWRTGPDEALIIQVTPPDCHWWNFEFGGSWMETVDYRYHLAGVNAEQAVLEEDGSVLLVVAHRDPGVPQWLDCAGYVEGYMVCRWIQSQEEPVPQCRLVKLADLPSVLPANVRRITPEERREQVRLRRAGAARRFRV